jgi:hypothetical protein
MTSSLFLQVSAKCSIDLPSIRATCPVHLIFFDLIVLRVLGENTEYEAPHDAIYMSKYKNSSNANNKQQFCLLGYNAM